MIKLIGALILLVSLTDSLPAVQSTALPATPPGIARTPLLDNPTVLVARLRFAPGAKEEPHTHHFSAVVVHLGPAEVDMQLGAERKTSHRDRGFTEFIAKEVAHAAANVGSRPFEIVTIAIKPDRTPATDMPASEAPPGVTRVPVLTNGETRVARVIFSVGAAEPMHAHPFDLVIVQVSSGHMGLIVGSGKERVTGVGSENAFFLPRNVPHAVANRGDAPLEIMSVAIK